MNRPSVIALCLISILPIAAGVIAMMVSGIDWAAFQGLLRVPGIGESLLLSIWTGLAATMLSLMIAHSVLAVAASRNAIAGLRKSVLPILATPHMAVAIGMVLLLSPSGLLLRLLSPWATGLQQAPDWTIVQDPWGLALILGLVIKETPFILLLLFAALSQVDSTRLMLQARTLGYGALKSWLIVIAPQLQRRVRLGVAAVLVFATTNVEVSLPLAPTTPPPFSVLLLGWFTDADLDLRARAFSGTWVLIAVSALCLAFAHGLSGLLSLIGRRIATNGRRGVGDAAMQRLILVVGWTLLGVGFSSIAALCLRASGEAWRFPRVWPTRMSLMAWHAAAPDLGAALELTVWLGLAVAFVTVVMVLLAAEALRDRGPARRRVGMLLFVPLLLPQMAALFGWQVMLVRLGWDGTVFAVAWTHVVYALPYTWALFAESRALLNPAYQISARSLGAGPWRTWLAVTAPMMSRSIILAFAVAFSVSVALYLPTVFAGAGRLSTLASDAGASITTGNIRTAAASGAVQALLPLIALGGALWLSDALFRNRRGVPR